MLSSDKGLVGLAYRSEACEKRTTYLPHYYGHNMSISYVLLIKGVSQLLSTFVKVPLPTWCQPLKTVIDRSMTVLQRFP